MENWRKFVNEEDELLSEGLGGIFHKLKDIFINTIDAVSKAGGGETELQGAMSDFLEAYTDMFAANFKGTDKYFHCVANCAASDRGWVGLEVAQLFSELREFTDQYLKRDPASVCDEDRHANFTGQWRVGPCADRCKEFIPDVGKCKIKRFSSDPYEEYDIQKDKWEKYLTKHNISPQELARQRARWEKSREKRKKQMFSGMGNDVPFGLE